MIKQHEFNTEWWGDEVGIITDPAFFRQSEGEQRSTLHRFAWVEFIQPASKLPDRRTLAEAGFFCSDTQVRFRIDLTRVKSSSCADALQIQVASETPFDIAEGDLKVFPYERFYALPGATESRINARYVRWAKNLVASHPGTCFRFLQDGKVQGWFLSQPESAGVELTLAMLSARAGASGFDLYSRALAEYGGRGFRLGMASFSVRNSPGHNIYAHRGARFLEPKECWMWVRP